MYYYLVLCVIAYSLNCVYMYICGLYFLLFFLANMAMWGDLLCCGGMFAYILH